MRFSAAIVASLASIASAEITTIYQTYGACQSDILTTLPLPYATTTSTFTIPLTTTVTRSVYPTAAPNSARDAADPPFPNATPAPELDERAMEERDLTIVYSWVCTGTNTVTQKYYSPTPVPGSVATTSVYASTSTSYYTLCIPGNICVG